jgi:hypothetical protein
VLLFSLNLKTNGFWMLFSRFIIWLSQTPLIDVGLSKHGSRFFLVDALPKNEMTSHPKKSFVISQLRKPEIQLTMPYGDGSKPCTPGEHQNSW